MIKLIKRILNYKISKNLTYFWNWGSLVMLCLIIQIITGLILATWYAPTVTHAFDMAHSIIVDVKAGWAVRFTHINFASVYFFALYVHVTRGLIFASYRYPRHRVWMIGVIIYILSIGIAFFGYSLPWTSMSYWAATVILSLASTVPYWGPQIAELIWGGYSIGQPTITRLFTFHYSLPFIVLALVGWHVYELHKVKSSDDLGGFSEIEIIEFTPTYTVKDALGYFILLVIGGLVVYNHPNLVTHHLNYVVADPLVTPPHIVPEWYFLPFYGILRSIPDKGIGVLVLLFSLLCLLLLPYISETSIINTQNRPAYVLFVWLFIINVVILGWTAAHPAEGAFIWIGRLCTFNYFLFFALLRKVERWEKEQVEKARRDLWKEVDKKNTTNSK